MAKRLTDKQKQEIIKSFKEGKTIDNLSEQFNCTNLTIIRNLKKNLGLTKLEKARPGTAEYSEAKLEHLKKIRM